MCFTEMGGCQDITTIFAVGGVVVYLAIETRMALCRPTENQAERTTSSSENTMAAINWRIPASSAVALNAAPKFMGKVVMLSPCSIFQRSHNQHKTDMMNTLELQ